MGLFRPYSQPGDEKPSGQDTPEAGEASPEEGKTTPTLTRREAEALRRERLRPTLTRKEQKARTREVRRAKEERAMAEAELRPERVLMRNFIDSRWTFSEFAWPLILLSLAVFLFGGRFPVLTFYGTYVLWAIMAVIVIEVAFLWFAFKKLVRVREPRAPLRGLLMMMASRMVTMRRFRRPPTVIDRGAPY